MFLGCKYKQMNELLEALARHMGKSVAQLMKTDGETGTKVATIILNARKSWDLPTPESMMIDIMMDIDMAELKANEDVDLKKFIDVYMTKTNTE